MNGRKILFCHYCCDLLSFSQTEWKEEIAEQLQKIKSEGSHMPQLEEIAFLSLLLSCADLLLYLFQTEWKEEIAEQLQKIKSEGSHMPQLEEELIKRRREELRHAQDVREHYERKLERANNLYMELTACMLQLEKRERELMK